jgi:hypothetical protein
MAKTELENQTEFLKDAARAHQSFSAFSIDQRQKDDFLLEAKRPDWTEKQCVEAKNTIQSLVSLNEIDRLSELPKHYFYFLNESLSAILFYKFLIYLCVF